ncbi:hypothetical protein F7725_010530 [Dissostichus mawsoni]|uniref:Uncharacterized protein n=1 Tax=Dissostichus mawsoni TaxID=36200 RepID=A0A7J5XNS0_DISMA|nr:hypothetical protein F7725_010530 [Dissostichus mawsoni]
MNSFSKTPGRVHRPSLEVQQVTPILSRVDDVTLTCMARMLRGMSSRYCRMVKCHVLILIKSSKANSIQQQFAHQLIREKGRMQNDFMKPVKKPPTGPQSLLGSEWKCWEVGGFWPKLAPCVTLSTPRRPEKNAHIVHQCPGSSS